MKLSKSERRELNEKMDALKATIHECNYRMKEIENCNHGWDSWNQYCDMGADAERELKRLQNLVYRTHHNNVR